MSTQRNPNGPADVIWEKSTFGKIWPNRTQEGNIKYRTEIGYVYTDRDGKTRDSNKLRDIDLLRLPSLSDRVRSRVREFQERDKQQQPSQDQTQATERQQFMQERVQQPDTGHAQSADREQFQQSRSHPPAQQTQDYGREP